MATGQLSRAIRAQIRQAVEYYSSVRIDFDHLAKTLHMYLTEDAILRGLIHSSKFRSKEPDRLRDKLGRKAREALESKREYTITARNLLTRIHDLGGVRLLHLHTKQMGNIDCGVRRVFDREHYTVVGRPVAHTWDIENEAFFRQIGLRTVRQDRMYTSVHYILKPAQRPETRIELQVRTLAEEVWGEVDHTFNYPHPTQSVACREQIKVLARLTSSCSRSVDAIFASLEEFEKKAQRRTRQSQR